MLPVVFIKSAFEMLDDLKYKKVEDLSPQEANFIKTFEFYMREYLLKRPEFSFKDSDPLKKYAPSIRKRYAVKSNLRDLRLKRGLTLKELGNMAGLTQSYLSRIEHGTRRLNSDTIQAISLALGCKPEYLVKS